MTLSQSVQMLDLQAQRRRLEPGLTKAIELVLNHCKFIMGPEVVQLEEALAAYSGAAHCVTCANGTDALVLVMMAEDIGPGDAVILPSFTFVATAEAVALRGATPVLADVDPTSFNLDAGSVERSIRQALSKGLRPRMILAVDLFGQPADYTSLRSIADRRGMRLVADGAQSFGATYQGRRVGALADYTTTSFFPSKPLGCYGDGGAIFTDDAPSAQQLRSLRQHGSGADKYDNTQIGTNSRLDTMQAAVLLEKLRILDAELVSRTELAERYWIGLSPVLRTPLLAEAVTSAWAQYTIVCESSEQRDLLRGCLATANIATAIYYPLPIHSQRGYLDSPGDPSGMHVSETLSQTVLSLPMHPYVATADADRVVKSIHDALEL